MRTKLIQIGRRLLQSVPSVFGIIVISFVLTRALPGDPAVYFAGAMADAEFIAQVREALGLDRSWLEQFFIYTGNLFSGDLGLSLSTGRPVIEELLTRLPASLELTFAGLGLAVLCAVPLGILAATRPGSWVDHLCRVLVTAGVSLPTFFTGLFLVFVFYYQLGWAPSPLGRLDVFVLPPDRVTGFYIVDAPDRRRPGDGAAAFGQLVLPGISLGLFALAPIARMTRASMLSVLSSDFVRTARANGLRGRRCSSPTRCATRSCRCHHARHDLLLPARRQCADREGVRLARRRLLRGRCGGHLRLRRHPGLRRPWRCIYVLLNLIIDSSEPWSIRAGRDRAADADGPADPLAQAVPLHHRREPADRWFAAVLFIVLVALFGPASHLTIRSPPTPPTPFSRHLAHPFGTDHLGRDVLSRVIVATRIDLGIAVSPP